MIRAPRVAALVLAAGFLAGCSGIKPYPDASPKNLVVKTEASSGSFFSSTRAAVHIHEVDASCRTTYLGTVELSQPTVEIGIPPGRLSYLVFSFYSSSFLGSSSGTISWATLLRPRAGYAYDATARYTNGIYHVVIRESGARASASHEIEQRGIADCARS